MIVYRHLMLRGSCNLESLFSTLMRNSTGITESKIASANFQLRGYKMKTHGKHYDPKWKKLRAMKVIKVELPDFEEDNDVRNMTPEEIRSKLKEKGLAPPRPWNERNIEITSTGSILEPYVPPEADGKASLISSEGAKQKAELVSKKGKSYMAIRKVKSFDEDFETKNFPDEALEIYIRTNEYLAKQDLDAVKQLVTEKAYLEVIDNVKRKTINWKFLESIEPPRIVHARYTDAVTKENVFAQITCRFFTKQILAVYDRFGRLFQGSEVIAKDVLEYVVFEKHLANEYGLWRVHGKVIPPWAGNPEDTNARTFKLSQSSI